MGYGQKTSVALAFQNSFGTPASVNSAFYVPFLNESLQKKIEPLVSEAIRGLHDEGESFEGPYTVDGDLETEIDMISFGAILNAAMDKPSATNSGSIYAHQFGLGQVDFDDKSAQIPVTIFADRDVGNLSQVYSDLNVNVLEMAFSNGEFLKVKASFVGGTVNSGAALTPVYPTGKKMTWDVTSISIDASANPELVDLTITIDNALEAMHTLDNSKTPNRIKRTGFRTVAVSGTLKFDDYTEYDAFINQDERPLSIHVKGPVEIQSGYTESALFTVIKLRHDDVQANADGPGQLEASFTSRIKHDTGTSVTLDVLLVNTQATYAP